MIEKIKDIFYDLTDVALALLIIVFMVTVITWKISDSLAFNITSIFADENKTESEELISQSEEENQTDIVEEETEKTEPENIENNNEDQEATNTEDEITIEETEPVVEEVTITIKSGSTGYSIAKLLEENNLINSTKEFIKRVEELELGAKLRSGTYTFKTNMKLDNIIYKLAGKN